MFVLVSLKKTSRESKNCISSLNGQFVESKNFAVYRCVIEITSKLHFNTEKRLFPIPPPPLRVMCTWAQEISKTGVLGWFTSILVQICLLVSRKLSSNQDLINGRIVLSLLVELDSFEKWNLCKLRHEININCYFAGMDQ